EAVKRDETLQKSKVCFLIGSWLHSWRGNGVRKKPLIRMMKLYSSRVFLVDDVKDTNELTTKEAIYNESESMDEDDMNDTVCAICDNGGDLTCCDGKCFRAFHATVESAEATAESKCISLGLPAEKVKGSQPFVCLNCTHEIHQCFACGELGSSNKSSGAKEENKKVKDLQFAVCRRCPKSYHRKCLPRTIVFDDEDDDDEFVVARAWNNLLPKSRALIFCLNIKFPEINHAKKKVLDNEEVSHSDYTSNEIRVGKTSSSVRPVVNYRKRPITLCGPGTIKKQRLTDAYETPSKKFVPVRSFGRSSTVMENWKNNNTAVSQQHGHIYKVQEPLLSKNVEAFDLPVENPEILSEKAIGQTTEKAESQKSSKHIAIAQQHGHIFAVHGPLFSDEHVEAYDLHVKKREILSEKDTSQTTDEVINCKSSKNIVVAQHQGPVSKVHEPLLSKIVEAFDFPLENHEFVSEKDTSRKTEVENQKSNKYTSIVVPDGLISKVKGPPLSENVSTFDLLVENQLPIFDRYVHLDDSPVKNCKSNGEKHAGQTTKKGKNRNSRKRKRRSKPITIAQQNAHISKIQEPKILGKSVHSFNSQVNNCDLNDIATRDPYASATDEQPYNKSRRLNDGVYFHGYERYNDYHDMRGYNKEAYNGNHDRHHQRYTLRPDEGNRKWMDNRPMWFYYHQPRGCDPGMYVDGFARWPFLHGPHHNSSYGTIDERMSYRSYVRLV
nr:hypothetical protein [Tanacetum cinerariifolium]